MSLPTFDKYNCPIRRRPVPHGVQDQVVEGTRMLSVGVVNTDKPLKKQISILKKIRKAHVTKVCKECEGNNANGGECTPASFFRGGHVGTIMVANKNQIPQNVKEGRFFYKEH